MSKNPTVARCRNTFYTAEDYWKYVMCEAAFKVLSEPKYYKGKLIDGYLRGHKVFLLVEPKELEELLQPHILNALDFLKNL